MMRYAASLGVLAAISLTLAGCLFLPPIAFNIEKASITREAARKFPPGTDAAAFEEWFVQKAGVGIHQSPRKDLEAAKNPSCEIKVASFIRYEGCRNELYAHYCVDPDGKLVSLNFEEGGLC